MATEIPSPRILIRSLFIVFLLSTSNAQHLSELHFRSLFRLSESGLAELQCTGDQSPAREYERASDPSKARSKVCKPAGAPGVGCTPLSLKQSCPALVL